MVARSVCFSQTNFTPNVLDTSSCSGSTRSACRSNTFKDDPSENSHGLHSLNDRGFSIMTPDPRYFRRPICSIHSICIEVHRFVRRGRRREATQAHLIQQAAEANLEQYDDQGTLIECPSRLIRAPDTRDRHPSEPLSLHSQSVGSLSACAPIPKRNRRNSVTGLARREN